MQPVEAHADQRQELLQVPLNRTPEARLACIADNPVNRG